MNHITGLIWLILILAPFLFVQRRLHLEIQAAFLMITRHREISMVLFSLLFFPGVLLHEVSHYLTARLLGVRTSKFSVIPMSMPDGRLRLGYVEMEKVDFIRDALIGATPLLTGGILVAYAGIYRLKLPLLWDSLVFNSMPLKDAAATVFSQADFWLWFYLAFTISSMMMPSASDRRAWLPVTLVIVALVIMALLGGAGPWMLAHLAPPLDSVFKAIAVTFSISAFLHLVLLVPVWIVRKLLSRLMGLDIA